MHPELHQSSPTSPSSISIVSAAASAMFSCACAAKSLCEAGHSLQAAFTSHSASLIVWENQILRALSGQRQNLDFSRTASAVSPSLSELNLTVVASVKTAWQTTDNFPSTRVTWKLRSLSTITLTPKLEKRSNTHRFWLHGCVAYAKFGDLRLLLERSLIREHTELTSDVSIHSMPFQAKIATKC